MDTAQVPPPRTNTPATSGKRSLRTPLISTVAILGTGALLWQLLGTANIFPSQAATPAVPRPAVAQTAPQATQTPQQPVSAPAHFGTGLSLVPLPYRSYQVTPRPLPTEKSEAAPTKPAADATPATATPASRDALPLQTSVAGGKAPRVGIAAGRPVTSGSGSSTSPGNPNPNG